MLVHGYKHYIEYNIDSEVAEAKGSYLLFDQFKVARQKNFTCPVKSLAIFVHNQDVDYLNNDLLKLLNDCQTLQDVHHLRYMNQDLIPPIALSTLNTKQEDIMAPVQAETVIFDQNFYTKKKSMSGNPLRLVAWIRFPIKHLYKTTLVRIVIVNVYRNCPKKQPVGM